MASESTEEGAVTVSLAPELEEWLDDRARDLGVDREAVLVRLLSSYRDAAAIDDTADVDGLATEVADSDPVRDVVEETVEDVLGDRERGADALETRLVDRLETVRADYQEKLDDVRDRVVQVKREVDGKAPADHTHRERERVEALDGRIADLEDGLVDLEGELSDLVATVRTAGAGSGDEEELEASVSELQERLKTVAWVVSDLREAYEATGGSAALERLKRSAAREDAARAKCERCGEGVEIALLTEPECPHCEATVTEVGPASGLFGQPQLLAASQLESGGER